MSDMDHAADAAPDQEAAVEWMVRAFYRRGLADDVLGPIFRGAIHDWEGHIRLVADFWSNALYDTGRYKGNAFAPHMKLRFEPEAFERWLAAFEPAAQESLPPEDADKAIRIARHMVQSYRAGLFPFTGPDGRPARTPART
jgi:hemoglobin